ncbi:hypothetical protein ACWDKQ_35595, partial [Saccharopolyspora sp. NPDC000995]
GDDQDEVGFSRALADRLGTQGSGLTIHAGAGPEGHTAGGGASSGSPGSNRAARRKEKYARDGIRRTDNKAARRARITELGESLKKLKADQASLEARPGWDGADADLRGQWEALQNEIAPVQAELGAIEAENTRLLDLGRARQTRYRRKKEVARLQAALLGGEGSSAGESAQVAEESAAAAELRALITNAEAGLQRMRDEGWPVYVGGVDVGVDRVIADMREHVAGVGVFGSADGLRNVLAHYVVSHPGDGVGMVELEERFHELTAAAQLHEWEGVAGRDAVDRLLADADGILGPLKASDRFRVVLAHWLGEHPGDWQGAQVVRGGLADSLSGDLDLGMARSGLTRDAIEEVKAKEERWQADRAGNKAVAGVVAAPMMREAVVDPGLSVIHQFSAVKRTSADAGRALRQLAAEHGQAAVDRLYAPAEKVLGPLHESRPFRDVIAHELMKNPRDDQQLQQLMTNPQADEQLQQLRWRLVRYLAGDLGGGADSSAADDLLSATVTPAPGPKEARSKTQQMYLRRVAAGKALSGLPDKDAVERVLRDEARAWLRGSYNSKSNLEARFNRGKGWADPVIADVRRQLISDLNAAVVSLQQILAEAETSTDLRQAYEAKIAAWSTIYRQTPLNEIHRRVVDASAAVRELRRNNAIQELQETYKTSYGGYARLQVLHGRDHVVREFDLRFGGMQDDQLRDMLSGSTEDVSGDADTDDTESVFGEEERAELLERLDRLRGDAEPPESHRSSGSREFGGRGARSDEELLADDSLGQGGRTPQWTVFGTDGSARPVAGPGAPVLAGGHGSPAGLAEASTAVPGSGQQAVVPKETPVVQTVSAQAGSVAGEVQPAATVTGDVGAGTMRDTGGIAVGRWSSSDLRREIDRARKLELSSEERDAAWLIVQGTHDSRKLTGDADVSVNDVVALVAAKHRKLGGDHRAQVVEVEFSRALAEKLGTGGSGLSIRAGAGPEDQAGSSGESASAAELSVLIAHANAGLEGMRRQGLPEETLPINRVMAGLQERMGVLVGGDG